jgi:predicted O-linked N-acetylglucosamine transferase (SPINDLY family)
VLRPHTLVTRLWQQCTVLLLAHNNSCAYTLVQQLQDIMTDYSATTGSTISSERSTTAAATGAADKRIIRVGFLSRYFYTHSVGLLAEGIIANLPRTR